MKNIVTSAWIVCAVFLCKISVADVVDSQKIPDVSVCIDNYENYLRSYKSIACSYAFNAPITNATGKMKYNGDHYWGLSDDGTMKMRIEILFDLPDKSIALYYKEEKKELSLFTWIVPPKNQGSTKLQNNLGIAEFFGYTNFFTASDICYVPDLLRGGNCKIKNDTKNGVDLLLVEGEKGGVLLKAWFDPTQNYLLRFFEQKRPAASAEGDLVSASFSFDQFVDCKGVKLPSSFSDTASFIAYGKPETVSRLIELSDFSITDNSNPKPFSFEMKVPNYTEVTVQDQQQIKYVWLDGKVVPWTDELAQKQINDAKFQSPAYKTFRYGTMTLGVILILLAIYMNIRKRQANAA